jgi:hypothetical protein
MPSPNLSMLFTPHTKRGNLKFDEETCIEHAACEVVGNGVLLVGDVGNPKVRGYVV